MREAEEGPAVALVEASVVGQKVDRRDALCPQILHRRAKQTPGDAASAIRLVDVYSADVRSEVLSVVEVVSTTPSPPTILPPSRHRYQPSSVSRRRYAPMHASYASRGTRHLQWNQSAAAWIMSGLSRSDTKAKASATWKSPFSKVTETVYAGRSRKRKEFCFRCPGIPGSRYSANLAHFMLYLFSNQALRQKASLSSTPSTIHPLLSLEFSP